MACSLPPETADFTQVFGIFNTVVKEESLYHKYVIKDFGNFMLIICLL